ncbi:MAG: hypothetical protein IT338_12000, partial [Thermomicrobiales bacterium]|nr:hypothetical protein [Thermomicrobiales bacterium]
GALFVLGSALNAVFNAAIYQFVAPAGQLLGSLVVIVALVVIAFRLPVPLLSPVASSAPDPWLVGVVSFAVWSLFLGLTLAIDAIGAWVVALLYLALYAVILGLTLGWSRRSGWGGGARAGAGGWGAPRLRLARLSAVARARHARPDRPDRQHRLRHRRDPVADRGGRQGTQGNGGGIRRGGACVARADPPRT